jgi:hypothetical protein
MNIHVYKTVTAIGIVRYVMKLKDGTDIIIEKSIKDVACVVQISVNNFFKKNKLAQATIDFTPFHDIEWLSGFPAERCFPLSEGEQEAFWLHFLKS